MTAYIGIDPGLSGAIAIIIPTSLGHVGIIYTLSMPLINREIDVNAIHCWLNKWLHLDDEYFGGMPTIAHIEKTWNVSKGGIAVARLNKSAGIMIGMLRTLDIPTYEVAPVTWKKEVLGNYRAKKQDAIEFCQKNFPEISLLRKDTSEFPDHNIAEAICLAEYGRRKHD